MYCVTRVVRRCLLPVYIPLVQVSYWMCTPRNRDCRCTPAICWMVQDRGKGGYFIISMPGFAWSPNIIPTRRTNQTGRRRYWNPAILIQVPASIDLALRSKNCCERDKSISVRTKISFPIPMEGYTFLVGRHAYFHPKSHRSKGVGLLPCRNQIPI